MDFSRNCLRFFIIGGMPRLLEKCSDKDRKEYLTSLYKEVYVKDIVERNKIQREDLLNDMLDFLVSQIGLLTNPTNVANSIASMKHEEINPAMISSYIEHTADAFLISEAKRYDVKGKTYFSYPNKYYYVEVGVFVDRRNGVSKQKEIDFIVNNGDKKIYIQSALRMDDDKKENAELDSLKLTKDFFKKIIVRKDISHNYFDDDGIFHCNLLDFLLNRVELF